MSRRWRFKKNPTETESTNRKAGRQGERKSIADRFKDFLRWEDNHHIISKTTDNYEANS